MLFSKTDYFNFVPGDKGRDKYQKWTEGGVTIYLQGPLPKSLHTKANKGNCYFAKKHLLTIEPPKGGHGSKQLQIAKGSRIAAKREDFSKVKNKADHDADRYGQNEVDEDTAVTFIFCQSMPEANLKRAFFKALEGYNTPSKWTDHIPVNFGQKIVHKIDKTGVVKWSTNGVQIGICCDGNGNFSIEHCKA